MSKLITFLRGINVSGKNKVEMAQLKNLFVQNGFSDVKTFLNSGNISFESKQTEITIVNLQIEKMLKANFDFEIPFFTIEKSELEELFIHKPDFVNENDKTFYDNIIFIIQPATVQQVLQELGTPDASLDKIQVYKNAIFWSFDRLKYQKSPWWKNTATTEISKFITIRTFGTVQKILKGTM